MKFFSGILTRSRRYRLFRGKITLNDLRAFGAKCAGSGRTLIVYIEFPYKDLIPHAEELPHFEHDCDRYCDLLQKVADGSYDSVIATGLLEHVRDPKRLLRECHRVLKKGGKLFLSASSVFAVHRGPDDFFHVTQFGMRELLFSQGWSHCDVRGSCGPFKTVAILLQRMLLQCEMCIILRILVDVVLHVLPFLDRCIVKQYSNRGFSADKVIDSMMPSNIQVIATK